MQGIYKITNKENKKIYIGQSKNIKHRWFYHIRELEHNRHHAPALQCDWNEYAPTAFTFEVLEIVEDMENILERELEVVKSYAEITELYNVENNPMPEEDRLALYYQRKREENVVNTELAKESLIKILEKYINKPLNKEQQRQLCDEVFGIKYINLIKNGRGFGFSALNIMFEAEALPYVVTSQRKRVGGKQSVHWILKENEICI